jgi:PIN domain nuclease of toxin-antitoxin system
LSLLIDTQLLIWATTESPRLSQQILRRIDDADLDPYFSAASIWEYAIKFSLGRTSFDAGPNLFRRRLLNGRYQELPVTGLHGAYVASLPLIHRDPFDRMLVAQATLEGFTLLTADKTVARYPGPIELVA